MAEEGGRPRTFDDDGRIKRTGTVWTASARIIAAVIGPGVLSLAWAIAQLGWVAGPAVIILFSFVTYCTSALLFECYRGGDHLIGERNYSYEGAVGYYLGDKKAKLSRLVQYVKLFGVCIGYTVLGSIGMMAVRESIRFHKNGGKDPCYMNSTIYMIVFGLMQIILSQIPNFGELWWLSMVAAGMSFTYSTIGLGLGIVEVIENGAVRGSLAGIPVGIVTLTQKIWRSFQALGDIAFAFSYSIILLEIQDTIRSPPPESETMKKAAFISIGVTSVFYMLCGCFGYAAVGDSSPRILLTCFGFYNSYWLLGIANAAIVIHLVGAYQVACQPLFALIERYAAHRFPANCFFSGEKEVPNPLPGCQPYRINLFRLAWRTVFVIMTTSTSMVLPFFTEIVGLVGALSYWPLTVYFPVEMYIVQKSIPKWSTKWICLYVLSIGSLFIGIAAAVGSTARIVGDVQTDNYKPFKTINF